MKKNELLRKVLSVSVMICMTVTAWSVAFADEITVCPEESPITTISAGDTGGSKANFKDSRPKLTAGSYAYNKIKLSWSTLSGAEGYVIYRAASKAGKYKQVAVLNGEEKTSYVHRGVKTAKTYYYKVRAYQSQNDKKIFSKYSAVKSASARPAKVKGLTVMYEQGDVVLKWKKQSGASGYQLQVRENGGKWKPYIEDGTYQFYPEKYARNYRYDPNQRYFTGTVARWIINQDKTYAYRIRSYRTVDGKKVFGLYSKAVELKQTITKGMLEEGITQYIKENHPNYKFYDTNLDGEPLTPENGSWGSEWPEPICRYDNFDIVMSRLEKTIDAYIQSCFGIDGEAGNGCPYVREENGNYQVWLLY